LAAYAFDQLKGYDNTYVTPENVCNFSSVDGLWNLPSAWDGLSTSVTTPNRFTGTYHHPLYKTATVSITSDGVRLTVGKGSGLLRDQTEDAEYDRFQWYTEQGTMPLGFIVSFKKPRNPRSPQKSPTVTINFGFSVAPDSVFIRD